MADQQDEAQPPSNSYYISAFGSLYDNATLPTKFRAGSSQYVANVKNMLPLGIGNLVAWGGGVSTYSSGVAVRHGVTGTSGGNIWNASSWGGDGGTIVSNRWGSATAFAFNGNGEIMVKDTNAATVPTNGFTATSYGGAYELFALGGKTVNVYSSGASSITLSGSVAADTLSTAYVLARSLPNPRIGDVIRLSNDAGTSFSYHRLTGGGPTTWNISPNTIFSSAGGKTFQILRTGWGSYSNVVQIFNTANNIWYDYYAGNMIDQFSPGTIECAAIDGTGNSAHYMAPQTTDGAGAAVATIKAVDVAYYKGFLLYGYGSSISWSKAGFPNSFTFGFADTDFPAANITVVASNDYFVGFEYLGEQLIALFRSSIWQVQATGSVPEFNFYKLPEQLGPNPPNAVGSIPAGRPSTSADGAIYYLSSTGVMELTGGLAKRISDPVQIFFDVSASAALNAVTWESFSDTVFFVGYSGPSGLCYHRPTGFWSTFDCSWASASAVGLTGLNPTGAADTLMLMHYNAVTAELVFTDGRFGGPANGGSTSLSAPWTWGSPVVAIGDMYSEVTGIQVDLLTASASYTVTINGGNTPVLGATQNRTASAPIVAIDNRKGLLGKKLDDAFVSAIVTGSTSSGSVRFGGVWLYLGMPQRR